MTKYQRCLPFTSSTSYQIPNVRFSMFLIRLREKFKNLCKSFFIRNGTKKVKVAAYTTITIPKFIRNWLLLFCSCFMLGHDLISTRSNQFKAHNIEIFNYQVSFFGSHRYSTGSMSSLVISLLTRSLLALTKLSTS